MVTVLCSAQSVPDFHDFFVADRIIYTSPQKHYCHTTINEYKVRPNSKCNETPHCSVVVFVADIPVSVVNRY